ncbi:MAG: Asp-tRNA(Asn)/Glu-tRNA(Gln) amidotransferase GatCAB subunit C [Chloroflexi bacterium]|jgi:aspartyl-tRNA(Asn)/glutamyl-tRNA(Gln) amidotransferase subunit C|nr:Asp-tRNA(Asn)/Glu-tRNA(Gln) amidotransferase GatCAB subunit C [Chloroflexota bacterium]MBI68180.1 Asp-tRNA(Asn)/Glu-tRNA(Gln) amidotransferase GatCAB subunit C [Chloroflexota bacterium]MCH2532293.1 Asp-tRNA(Asn)/Glu-tRNA(Gln) amidotransferase subunit GatC [Dehalococcoidia bacterium]HCH36316.1 Asp-tRNA(Asn)/Glu-tRNA(Gln) amidotransferase subunit GatB [Dehalococcoidia bacterium]|tara:strand:+ start:4414 stop:4731 length:318 start_codon:yes stop_codon:yes gene_type:complete
MSSEPPKQLSIEEVLNVARLCHLEFSDDELNQLAQDMASLIKEVDVLREINTDNVTPSAHAVPTVHSVMREDIPRESLSQEDVLKNAPMKDGFFFRVAQVMDKSS